MKERADRPFRMVFAGTGQDEGRLRRMIRRLGLEEQTVFTGNITDRTLLASLYARADLMLFPSLYDTSSLVQVEAASQGTAALYVRGAVTAETVTEGVNGFLAEDDPEAYAEAILALMADPGRLREAGENARRDLYVSWKDVARKVFRRYRELVRGYRA